MTTLLTVSGQQAHAQPDPASKGTRNVCTDKPLTQQSDSNSKPCIKTLKHENTNDNKDKKSGRVWWCKKKLALRRTSHSPAVRSVDDNSTETQYEINVKDLAQMTDNILRVTGGMIGDPQLCICSAKPCECLNELAETVVKVSSTANKPTAKCECPPPILILKKSQQENSCKNDAIVLREQGSFCSCIAFLQKHDLLHTGQTIVHQTATEVKCQKETDYRSGTPGGSSVAISPGSCRILKPLEPTVGDQNNNVTRQCKPSSTGSKKNIICECSPPTTKPMIAGQNGKGGCPGTMSDGDGMKKIICECSRPKTASQTGGSQTGKDRPCQGPGGKENVKIVGPPSTSSKQMTRGQNGKIAPCPGTMSDGDGMKKKICECAQSKTAGQMRVSQAGQGKPCQGMVLESSGKENVPCECSALKAPEQMAKGQGGVKGTCYGMSEVSSNKNITFDRRRPTATQLKAGGENGKDETSRCTLSTPGSKENVVCECPQLKATEQTARGRSGKTGTCHGTPEPNTNKNTSSDRQRPTTPDNRSGASGNVGTCPGMPPGSGGTKNGTCKCPPLKGTERASGSHYGNDGTCHCMDLVSGGMIKMTCECPKEQTARGRDGKDGPCLTPGAGSKLNVRCECPRPTPDISLTGGPICRDGTCQGASSSPCNVKNVKCECLPTSGAASTCSVQNTNGDGRRPQSIVKEKSSVQFKKGGQHSCDNLAKVEFGKKSQNPKSDRVKKTGFCESPSKEKLQLCSTGKASSKKKTGSNKITIGLKSKRQADCDECAELQSKKTRVQWSSKKHVISGCPPVDTDDLSNASCMSAHKKKQLKKIAKNEAKVKISEKQVDSSCTDGAVPCLCKEESSCRLKDNKCECPCPLLIEEVDLNSKIDSTLKPAPLKGCLSTSATLSSPAKDEDDKTNKNVTERDREQMTEDKIDKIDKCSYTDRLIKNICKTKNKSTGQGKWGKRMVPPCICPPEPPTTERGCDPPCVKEQWKMRSRQTCSKSGFTVQKKPAARVDYTMCFEEALAYFELHPEDDPMQKKKKKVTCECPSCDNCDSFGNNRRLPYCFGRL